MKKKNKNIIFVGSMLFVISLAIIVGATYSFFVTNSKRVNSLTLGNNDIAFFEPNWEPSEASNVTPGKSILKDPTVSDLEGDNYVRLVVEFYDSDTNNLITKANRINKIKDLMYYDVSYDVNSNPVTTNLISGNTYSKTDLNSLVSSNKIKKLYNDSDFVFDDKRSTDNKLVFNYKNILHEGEKKVLFTNLVIPTEFTAEDLNLLGNFKLRIHAEAIQSANVGSSEEAFEVLD